MNQTLEKHAKQISKDLDVVSAHEVHAIEHIQSGFKTLVSSLPKEFLKMKVNETGAAKSKLTVGDLRAAAAAIHSENEQVEQWWNANYEKKVRIALTDPNWRHVMLNKNQDPAAFSAMKPKRAKRGKTVQQIRKRPIF